MICSRCSAHKTLYNFGNSVLCWQMVASKYLYDEGEDEEVFNDDWARAGKEYSNTFCSNHSTPTLAAKLKINISFLQ